MTERSDPISEELAEWFLATLKESGNTRGANTQGPATAAPRPPSPVLPCRDKGEGKKRTLDV